MGVRAGERACRREGGSVWGRGQAQAFFYFLRSVYLSFLAALGLFCCAGFSLDAPSVHYPLVVVCKLLIAVASLVTEHGL